MFCSYVFHIPYMLKCWSLVQSKDLVNANTTEVKFFDLKKNQVLKWSGFLVLKRRRKKFEQLIDPKSFEIKNMVL